MTPRSTWQKCPPREQPLDLIAVAICSRHNLLIDREVLFWMTWFQICDRGRVPLVLLLLGRNLHAPRLVRNRNSCEIGHRVLNG